MARKRDGFAPMVATANELRSGRVVFRDAAGAWTPALGAAAIAAGEAAAEALLRAAQDDAAAGRVIDPALVEIVPGDGPPRLASLRERIRAAGPTAGLPGDAPPFA